MKKLIFSICLLLLVTGCGPRLVYPHLDWLIPFYVDDYISLNREQSSLLEKRLLQVLDWHCRTQLPAYAQSLRELAKDLENPRQPVSYKKFEYYSNQFMTHWRELSKKIGPEAADILATASDEQIAELLQNIEKRNNKFKSEYVDIPLEKLEEKRKARISKDLKHWISRLKSEQKQVVSDWSDQILPIAADGLRYRKGLLTEFQNLLTRRRQNPHFQEAFVSLLDNFDKFRTLDYQQKIDFNTALTFKLLMEIEQSLSTTQRAYLLQQIYSLATDFDKLSCDPVQIQPKEQELSDIITLHVPSGQGTHHVIDSAFN
jgi:molecular chaperone GrpE (heat shock protein)